MLPSSTSGISLKSEVKNYDLENEMNWISIIKIQKIKIKIKIARFLYLIQVSRPNIYNVV
jgi:hypothetical protein